MFVCVTRIHALINTTDGALPEGPHPSLETCSKGWWEERCMSAHSREKSGSGEGAEDYKDKVDRHQQG